MLSNNTPQILRGWLKTRAALTEIWFLLDQSRTAKLKGARVDFLPHLSTQTHRWLRTHNLLGPFLTALGRGPITPT
jgi:hypothetical protein